MQKRNELPTYFSDYFKIDKEKFKKLGAFNPILNFDTKLFVEPLLLRQSSSKIMHEAFNVYNNFFVNLLKLLMISTQTGDKAWKQAKKIVNFPEYQYTCIGYGSDSINGSGSGANLNDKIFQSAKEIVDKAKNDPSIFLLLPLLEEGIGADRISDMAQGIIDNEICKYTAKIMNELEIVGNTRYQTKPHSFEFESQTYNLLKNPYTECVIKLLPSDVLSSLPLADTFDSWAVDVIETNAKLRDDINRHFGLEWFDVTKKYKKGSLTKRNESKTIESFSWKF